MFGKRKMDHKTKIELDLFDVKDVEQRKLIAANIYEINAVTEENQELASQEVKDNLWDKVKKVAQIIGVKVIKDICYLWDAMVDPNVPWKAKAMAIAALIYFISPIDVIPDFLPGGFVDDAAAIVAAVKAVIAILVSHGINLRRATQFNRQTVLP